MEVTSTSSWNITMMLMINVMLVLLVHVVQPLPQGRIYFPEFSPPPPPPPPRSPNPYLNPNGPPPSGTSSLLNTRYVMNPVPMNAAGK